MTNHTPSRDPVPGELEIYRQQLAGHDWFYDYSDDFGVWKRGSEKRAALAALRKRLDPEGTIWNEYAPEQYKVKPIYKPEG